MAGFHGQQGFHRRHAHRQWGPPPTPPTTAASLVTLSLPRISPPFTSRDGAMAPPAMPPAPSPPPSTPRLGTEIVTLLLRTQIEYYFSEDNLARNVHLKMQMDEEGWVSVKRLTNDVVLILRSLQPSPPCKEFRIKNTLYKRAKFGGHTWKTTKLREPHYFSPHEPSLGYRTWILPTSSGR
ncbi:unnamed protein product [Spirodela intermedia]|uniref:HTH La-type RNA-binding domain-containing protein n=1 Tax=Spirodela intermedia TaxID=51605 RepID=A0A7I8IUW8_SPIIN|nr:unnamed protein product [Spirodela intermedia]CAA6661362.1 unnamed protein product [Spirodela intermedia]